MPCAANFLYNRAGAIQMKASKKILPREEWPYEVPGNWVWTQLGGLCNEIQYGYTAKAIQNDKFPKMLRITDIQDNRVNWNEVPNCEIADTALHKYELIDGDIVFARTGATTGKSYIITLPPKAVYASYLIRVRLLPHVNNNYAYNFLQTSYYWNYITEVSAGIAQPGCNAAKLANLPVPLPPLPEQQRIVARIESLFAKLDAAAEKIRAALDQFPIRKAAILHKAFTGELTKKWRKENGVGMESWKDCHLKDILHPMTRKLPTEKTFRYVDIDSIDNKTQTIRAPKVLLAQDAPSRAQRELKVGDVIFSVVRPYLKNIAIIKEEFSDCIASTGFYVCRPQRNTFPKFLYHKLCHDESVAYISQFMKGDNSPSVRKDDFLSLPIKLPSFSEQKEIVRILDNIFAREQAAKDAAERLLERVALTKKSILARAFRGKLGTNDPTEESAERWLSQENTVSLQAY